MHPPPVAGGTFCEGSLSVCTEGSALMLLVLNVDGIFWGLMAHKASVLEVCLHGCSL